MCAGSFPEGPVDQGRRHACHRADRLPAAQHRPLADRGGRDADRLTEGAANALLKVVEEPPPSTVFLLCARRWIRRISRSPCGRGAGTSRWSPVDAAIAQVLIDRDGLDEQQARWAASVSRATSAVPAGWRPT